MYYVYVVGYRQSITDRVSSFVSKILPNFVKRRSGDHTVRMHLVGTSTAMTEEDSDALETVPSAATSSAMITKHAG